MDERCDILKGLREKLAGITVRRDFAIDEGTELYLDLYISGTDLYEFLAWVANEYGVDFNGMKLPEYAPLEGQDPYATHRGLFKKIPFKSLTLGALMASIETGVWTG